MNATIRIILAAGLLLTEALAETSVPKPEEEKEQNEPTRVPVMKCTQVCDRPLGSPNTEGQSMLKKQCETKCEPAQEK